MSAYAGVMKSGEGESLSVLGTEVRFLCPAAATNHRFSIMEVVLPRDCGPPPHEHPWDEAYYVMEGEVRFRIGADVQVFRRGDFVYAPGGTLHAFCGISEQPARVLVFDAPAAAERFFREVAREAITLPGDGARLLQLGLQHQLHFAAPQ